MSKITDGKIAKYICKQLPRLNLCINWKRVLNMFGVFFCVYTNCYWLFAVFTEYQEEPWYIWVFISIFLLFICNRCWLKTIRQKSNSLKTSSINYNLNEKIYIRYRLRIIMKPLLNNKTSKDFLTDGQKAEIYWIIDNQQI